MRPTCAKCYSEREVSTRIKIETLALWESWVREEAGRDSLRTPSGVGGRILPGVKVRSQDQIDTQGRSYQVLTKIGMHVACGHYVGGASKEVYLVTVFPRVWPFKNKWYYYLFNMILNDFKT